MARKSHLTCLSAVALLALGCSASDTPTPDSQASAASQSAAVQRSAQEDLVDVINYKLTMDKIDKYFTAQRNIAMKVKDMTPEQQQALNMGNSANASLDEIARNMERSPEITDAVEDAGLSAREYATLTMAFVQAAMASSVLQMRPNDNQDSLAREMKASMDNIRFMREHEADITRKQQDLATELQRMGMPTE